MGRYVPSAVAIYNQALAHIGVTQRVSAADERTEEARTCSLFYDEAVDRVVRAFAWPCATVTATLELVAGPNPPPTMEWTYSYRYPNDCLKIRRILNQISRVETRQTRAPYRIVQDSQGLLIYTDYEPVAATDTTPALPQIEYTMVMDDPSRWTSDFSHALSLMLAALIAPSLTAGDKFKLGARAFQLYKMAIADAEGNAADEEQADLLPESEFIRARDGGYGLYGDRRPNDGR